MMKMYRACFLLFFPLALIAQNPASDPDWSSLITQPNANFYQLSELHRQAWMNREIVPSCGWKPFKRWEWLMSSRLHEDGTPITGSEVVATWRELMDYNQSRSLSGNWHQLGPILDDVTTRDEIGGVGRTSIIAFHPENENIVLAGTPAGGLWKSMDGGNSWTTNTDWLPTLGVSCIAFDPENPGVVYIGTGDRDAGDAPGMGVMKSTDDGDNWEFVNDGIENLTVGAIQILPGLGVILIGTNDGIFR